MYLLNCLQPGVVQFLAVSVHPLQQALLLRGRQSTTENGAVHEFDHHLTACVRSVQVWWRVVSKVNTDRDARKVANWGHTQPEPRPSDILASLQPQTVLSAEHLRNNSCARG